MLSLLKEGPRTVRRHRIGPDVGTDGGCIPPGDSPITKVFFSHELDFLESIALPSNDFGQAAILTKSRSNTTRGAIDQGPFTLALKHLHRSKHGGKSVDARLDKR